MTGKPETHCELMANAVLKICVNCRRAVYMTVPCYEVCIACRTGAPPIGPVVPPMSDVSGVPITGP